MSMMLGFGAWIGVALYLVLFFLTLHLVDRLAHRVPPEADAASEES